MSFIVKMGENYARILVFLKGDMDKYKWLKFLTKIVLK